VATGAYPDLLGESGVAAALRAVSRNAAIPIRIEDRWRRRHPEAVEVAVYSCSLEALQNAAKHAGPGSAATVRLTEENGSVGFTIEDHGVGFDPASAGRGTGLQNIADRVCAAGGTLRIESAAGQGTRVSGRLPG